jgi:hypothetical protein
MTTSTWQLSPNISPPKTNPHLPVAVATHECDDRHGGYCSLCCGALRCRSCAEAAAASAAEADLRHRAHCPICSDDPGDADAYVDALFNAHAPWLTGPTPAALQRPDRPHLAQLLTNRAGS